MIRKDNCLDIKLISNLFRFRQYVKNLFIFAPLFFSFNFNLELLVKCVFAFILFSFLASSVYIYNDLTDKNEDSKHPVKRLRPIASGLVSERIAKTLMLFLSGLSLICSLLLDLNLFIIFIIYFILNISYSIKLKHIPIIDVFVIAIGFVLRLFVGSVTTGITLSFWIIIITFLLALFLGFAKRRDDVLLSMQGKATRKNIDGYNLDFTNYTMVATSSIVIVSYILYTVSDGVCSHFGTKYLYLTTFFVLLGFIRYMQITFVENMSGDPTELVLKDGFLKFACIGYIASFIIVVKFL